jgi:predicted TIM-barrel fold metal-dependent hydrolase
MNMKDFYTAIDIHSHFNHGAVGEMSDDGDPLLCLQGKELEFLIDEAKRFNVKATAYSSYASVLGKGGDIVSENEYLHSIALENDEVFQWVVIHPEIKETFLQAERMLESKKVLGIKLHPALHGYSITEKGDSVFSFANDLGTAVLIHPTNVLGAAKMADNYPNMSLIIAHLGSRAHIDAIKNAKNGNVYTDTSGYLSSLNRIIEIAVEEIGSEHILFGTDTYSHAFQYCRVAFADIPEEDKRNILYLNAKRLFKLEI